MARTPLKGLRVLQLPDGPATACCRQPPARAGAVNTNAETPREPQLLAVNIWQELERAYVGRHPHAGMGIGVDGAPPPLLRPAPTLGEHDAEALPAVLGLKSDEIATLTAALVALFERAG